LIGVSFARGSLPLSINNRQSTINNESKINDQRPSIRARLRFGHHHAKAGVPLDAPSVDPLKYQGEPKETRAAGSGELFTVKVRFKEPDGDTSRLLSRVLTNQPAAMTANLGFASAVAEFGMLLRESPLRGGASFESLTPRARKFQGEDEEGYRAQFIQLAERAAMLREREPAKQSRR
jgi:hypothetical protein